MSISFRGAKKYKKRNGFRTFSEFKTPLPSPMYFYKLHHGNGIILTPLVKEGDRVLRGEKLADLDAFGALPVFSSVSGNVISVNDEIITVENDMAFEEAPKIIFDKSIDDLTASELLWIIRECGVCEAKTGVPVHTLLSPKTPVKIVLVCCFDSDPYVSSAQASALGNAEKILDGLGIVLRILGIKKAAIGTENDTNRIFSDFKYRLRYNTDISLYSLKPYYPQDDEGIFIKTLTGKSIADAGAVILSAETLCNISDVFAKGVPVTEKAVTVSGDDILPPDNFLVPIGSPVSMLLTSAGYTEPQTVIIDSLTNGEEVTDLDTPVTNHTRGVIIFNKKENIPNYRNKQ